MFTLDVSIPLLTLSILLKKLAFEVGGLGLGHGGYGGTFTMTRCQGEKPDKSDIVLYCMNILSARWVSTSAEIIPFAYLVKVPDMELFTIYYVSVSRLAITAYVLPMYPDIVD